MRQNPQVELLAIKTDTSDKEVAELIVDYLLMSDRIPYRFGINHNTGAPDFKACPLLYDWSGKRQVGIETRDRVLAKKWLTNAALLGYTVSRMVRLEPDGFSSSIELARSRAARHQAPKPEIDDDDIPF